MAKTGRIGGRYSLEVSADQRNLARVLALFCELLEPGTLAAKAARLLVSKAALSHYVNARRIPSVETLRRLHELAAEGSPGPLPCSLKELLHLRELAKSKGGCDSHCALVHDLLDRRNRNSVGEVDRRNGKSSTGPVVARERRPDASREGSIRTTSACQASAPAHAIAIHLAGKVPDGITIATNLYRNGNLQEAREEFLRAGASLPPAEVAAAADYCLDTHRLAAAVALLVGAGHRAPQDVLDMVRHLLASDRLTEAKLLLDAYTSGPSSAAS